MWPEEGNDTVYLYDDGVADVVRCDDMDTPEQRAQAGTDDRVVYIGAPDPLDVIWDSCESVTSIASLPAGWPYGPVGSIAARSGAVRHLGLRDR